jgi:hypothetical protein
MRTLILRILSWLILKVRKETFPSTTEELTLKVDLWETFPSTMEPIPYSQQPAKLDINRMCLRVEIKQGIIDLAGIKIPADGYKATGEGDYKFTSSSTVEVNGKVVHVEVGDLFYITSTFSSGLVMFLRRSSGSEFTRL